MPSARLGCESWESLSVFPGGEMKRCDPKTIEAARKANRSYVMAHAMSMLIYLAHIQVL